MLLEVTVHAPCVAWFFHVYTGSSMWSDVSVVFTRHTHGLLQQVHSHHARRDRTPHSTHHSTDAAGHSSHVTYSKAGTHSDRAKLSPVRPSTGQDPRRTLRAQRGVRRLTRADDEIMNREIYPDERMLKKRLTDRNASHNRDERAEK